MSISYSLSNMFNKMFKTNVQHYCQLETSSKGKYMVTREGGLMCTFEVEGTFGVVGNEEFYTRLNDLTDGLSSVLKRPGHKVQFVFRRDPLNSRESIRRSINAVTKTMETLSLDLAGLAKERGDFLEKKTVLESCYLVLTTTPLAVHPDILSTSLKVRTLEAGKAGGMKPGENAQSVTMEIPDLATIHEGFVAQVNTQLKNSKLSIKSINPHEYLRVIAKQISQYALGDSWRGILPGDVAPFRLVDESPMQNDMSHILWPEIAHQLFSREPKQAAEDTTIVDNGEWKIAPLLVDQRPQEPKPFSKLFEAIDRNLPWQFSLHITSGHDRICTMISRRKTFAQFVAFASSENGLIRDAAESILAQSATNTLVSVQMTFSTWGKTVEEARGNRSRLKSAVESWGQMLLVEERGDSVEAWLNTIPGFCSDHLATPIPITVLEALGMAPTTRPVSPWKEGSMLYRTVDEKLFPFMPGSDLQTANMELVFAPPGFGKSFYLAASNMGLMTRPGNEILPRIGILDIGFSSKMFVDLVRDALPDHMKHLAQSFQMEMSEQYAVNFFDTPLGCQFPLTVDRESVTNMMTLLCTPAGNGTPTERLPELVSSLVDEMYIYFSEDGTPNMYEPGVSPLVDRALSENRIEASSDMSWWHVSKLLFRKGLYQEAVKAQTFAVPTLNDATTVLSQASSITDVYGGSKVDGVGESLVSYLKTMISSAVRDYPILSQPTIFSLGEARVVSIDLMSVARDGSAQAKKRTAIMYMLARNLICRDFYRSIERTLPDVPEEFRQYHRRAIEKDEASPKKLCMDEYHRTASSPAVRAQAATDIREGRKFDVHVSLVSQLLEDFDSDIIKIVNNIIIFSKGVSELTLNEIKEKFSPSVDAVRMMRKWLTGPGPEGSSFLILGQLNDETEPRLEQVLRLSLGPSEIWAFTTKPQDVSLRKRVSSRIGLSNALKILAVEYPRGSAKADMMRLGMEISDDINEIDEDNNIFDVLTNKLIADHKDLIDPHKIKVA